MGIHRPHMQPKICLVELEVLLATFIMATTHISISIIFPGTPFNLCQASTSSSKEQFKEICLCRKGVIVSFKLTMKHLLNTRIEAIPQQVVISSHIP